MNATTATVCHWRNRGLASGCPENSRNLRNLPLFYTPCLFFLCPLTLPDTINLNNCYTSPTSSKSHQPIVQQREIASKKSLKDQPSNLDKWCYALIEIWLAFCYTVHWDWRKSWWSDGHSIIHRFRLSIFLLGTFSDYINLWLSFAYYNPLVNLCNT